MLVDEDVLHALFLDQIDINLQTQKMVLGLLAEIDSKNGKLVEELNQLLAANQAMLNKFKLARATKGLLS